MRRGANRATEAQSPPVGSCQKRGDFRGSPTDRPEYNFDCAGRELADLFSEDKSEEQENEEEDNSGGKVFLVLVAIPLFVFLLFDHLAGPEMGLTASLCSATILIAVGICWDLRRRPWFWIAIAVVAALHAPLVFMVRWPHARIPGIALAPIGFADCMIIVGIIRLVQKRVMKEVPPKE